MGTLNKNKIPSIQSGTFSNLTNLNELDISSNLITKIEKNSFSNLRKLRTLNLNDNHLNDLPNGLFSDFDSIFVITIADNPWMCDCSLAWLQNFQDKLNEMSNTFCKSNDTDTELMEFIRINCIITTSTMSTVYDFPTSIIVVQPTDTYPPNDNTLILIIILVIFFILIIVAALALFVCKRRKCGFWKIKNSIDTENMKEKRHDLAMKISDSNSFMSSYDTFSKGKLNESMHAYDNTMMLYENETDDQKIITKIEMNKLNENKMNERPISNIYSSTCNTAVISELKNYNSLKNLASSRPQSYHEQEQKHTKPIFTTSQSVDGSLNNTQYCNNAFDNETKKRTLPLGMHSASSIHSIDTMYDGRTGDYRPISFFDDNNDE